jgi:conserved oligomeric Golgi complex subunit 6
MSTSSMDATATPLAVSAGSMNILSDKVQRALQVRTDTPAMKAALEALGQLERVGNNGGIAASSIGNSKQTTSHYSNNNNSSFVAVTSLDARSVRHAIEYDALQQALHLQQNLSNLVMTIRELRQGISDCAALAAHVKHAINTNVVTEMTRTSMISTTTTTFSSPDGSSGDVTLLTTTTSSDQQQQQYQQQHQQNQQAEEKLAATIAEAFQRRNVARHRLEAVTQFLETFDLSEKDSRLLDHYNFEDMMHNHHHNVVGSDINNNSLSAAAAAPNGMAFLRALERVWQIRRALVKTFGGGGGGMSGGLSGNNNYMMMESSFDSGSPGEKSGLGASSALRMMESLAQKQEHAYERLYRTLM